MNSTKQDRPLQRQDFVEPQRNGPSVEEQQHRRKRLAQLQEFAADPKTTPQRAHQLERLAMKSEKRRTSTVRRANAKSITRLQDTVLNHIVRGLREGVLSETADLITREAVARRLTVPEHQVEQVFARLVQQGLLAKQPNNGAHDTRRNWLFGGSDTGWAPTYWRLRNLARWREMLPSHVQN